MITTLKRGDSISYKGTTYKIAIDESKSEYIFINGTKRLRKKISDVEPLIATIITILK